MTLAAALFIVPAGSPACLLDVAYDSQSPSIPYLFPNWQKAEVVDFDTVWCNGTACPGATDATIRGMTIFNYGTAAAGTDIKAIYTCFGCYRSANGACNPAQTLTYAGVWNVGAGSYPAWTWSGSLALNTDPCNAGASGCACIYVLRVFITVGECPADGATVKLGPGFNDGLNPLWPGGIYDAVGCVGPWNEISDPSIHPIVYAVKVGDQDQAAPGDTVNYTIYYGRPGTGSLSSITVIDSQPPYTHLVWGSTSPSPDAGWDPNPGPPLKMRWTIPGPLGVSGGPTGKVLFSLTVDWGNGNLFEPGSGNVAAPEQERLGNRAHVFFGGIAGCGTDQVVTSPTTTAVRRFLFWKFGDNDLLFSPTLGQSPDEMIYSIFAKNVSPEKTWWEVRIWDTVPPELDVWCQDCGFEDPCAGWTMTPTGCAYASPGKSISGGVTLLTWRMDMPPGMTITLRWKGQVKATVSPGGTAVNRTEILEYGRTGIVSGTGHSGKPRSFSHLAPIVLPTTYVSYVGIAAGDQDNGCPGFIMDLFPLNKKTQFELRALQYEGTGWSTSGGVSASIGTLIGDCIGGFPGGGGIPGGGIAGCKAERVPAAYDPAGWQGTCPTFPSNFVYKLTSNSPVVWQMLTHISADAEDNHTYAPSTTLAFTGLIHYMWRRTGIDQSVGFGDSLSMISTAKDAFGVIDASRKTTVHLFRYEYGTLSWVYRRTYELDGESQTYDMGTSSAEEGPWMTASSDVQLIVNHAFNNNPLINCCAGCCANNFSAFMPNRETGNVVSLAGSGTHYGLVAGDKNVNVILGNVGPTDASCRIWKYVPANQISLAPMPPDLNGTSGNWVPQSNETVPAGLAAAGNPRVYSLDGAVFKTTGLTLFKVEVLSGGPVQVLHGAKAYTTWSGGSVIHAANGNQTGQEFWLNDTYLNDNWGKCSTGEYTMTVNLYCPKTGMAIRAVSGDGYSATYTTSGPDQCVSFTALTNPAINGKRNYRFSVLPGPSTGNIMAQFIQCNITEKGYTAPFLATGTHYQIIAPPVVYLGQSFWITIVVLEVGGGTKTDYTGTSSFTSTDPGAKIEGKAMDSYNYTWVAGDAGVRIFMNVIFNTMGVQTIVAVDTQDGSISGLAATLVVAADIKLEKRKKLSIAASGDTVQFQICWSNYSTSTGFSFTITDAVPMGTSYVPEIASTMLCGTSAPVPGITVYYSTATTTVPPGTFTSVPGTGSPLGNTRWLRWTIRNAYVNSTGCVCFKVSVN